MTPNVGLPALPQILKIPRPLEENDITDRVEESSIAEAMSGVGTRTVCPFITCHLPGPPVFPR